VVRASHLVCRRRNFLLLRGVAQMVVLNPDRDFTAGRGAFRPKLLCLTEYFMKESGIINAIMSYLQYQENLGRCLFQRNNSGAFINPRGNFFKMGKRGSPDFYIFMPQGRTIHLEVKNEKGKQNINQLDFETKIKNLGHKYYVVRSVDEVEKILFFAGSLN